MAILEDLTFSFNKQNCALLQWFNVLCIGVMKSTEVSQLGRKPKGDNIRATPRLGTLITLLNAGKHSRESEDERFPGHTDIFLLEFT